MAPEITRITDTFLHNPVRVEVDRQAPQPWRWDALAGDVTHGQRCTVSGSHVADDHDGPSQ